MMTMLMKLLKAGATPQRKMARGARVRMR